MTVILYVIKVCSKFFSAYYGLDNVDLQNNYAIEIMKLFKKLACSQGRSNPGDKCDICRTNNFQNTNVSEMLRLNSDWCLDHRSSRAVFESQYIIKQYYTRLIYMEATTQGNTTLEGHYDKYKSSSLLVPSAVPVLAVSLLNRYDQWRWLWPPTVL